MSMTQREIDRVLEAFDADNNPAPGRYISEVRALAEVVADQERRLRALERVAEANHERRAGDDW